MLISPLRRITQLRAHLSPEATYLAPESTILPRFSKRTMANLSVATKRHKVAVVGSGNWGSAIAKIVAENAKDYPNLFELEVQMWVYEEECRIPKTSKHYDPSSELCTKPQKLTTLINGLHENPKYLPGIVLPQNLIANPSLEDSVKDATLLIFNMPHQFIARICDGLRGKTLPFARGISCIKGIDVSEKGVNLFSESIGEKLGIFCGALSGANIANEVALEKWSETTIAYEPPLADSRENCSPARRTKIVRPPADYPPLSQENIKKLFHRPYFHVRMVKDVAGVSLGGALKNVVALAAGFVVGLGWGDNAKAAVMRVGILEQVKFGESFFRDSFQAATMTEESCGVADLITSCSGGRNFRCAKMSVERGVSIEEVEKTELNGQKLQGTSTAYEVHSFLKSKNMEKDFPLFTAVYDILEGNAKPEQIPDLIEPKGL